MSAVRVLLVDDHDLVRTGIRLVLKHLPDVEVVGECGDGRQALAAVEEFRPDVVLMDIVMPALNGLDSTEQIVKRFPGTRVIMLSMNAAEEYVLQSLHKGASGYLLKNVSPSVLDEAIRTVHGGKIYLASDVSKRMDGTVIGPGGDENYERSSYDRLTPRQREVLQLIAEGNSTKEIARKLDISVKTVEMHRAQLMASLDIHDVAGLVRYAIRRGIVNPQL
jgi:DNA-binding NarL/FixJ family response regulator